MSKRPTHARRGLWSAFIASTAAGTGTITANIWWSTDHINIARLCGNQFTYPQHIDACDSWFHRDNIFSAIGTAIGISALIAFLGLGIVMAISYLDRDS